MFFQSNKFVAVALACAVALLSASTDARACDKKQCNKSKKECTKKSCKRDKKKTAALGVGHAERGLASLRSPAAMGQGEQMLSNVKSTAPRFLATREKGSSPVKLAGLCRDEYGVVYNSTQSSYSDCVDSRSTNTGGAVDDYVKNQRQAGLGFVVGN